MAERLKKAARSEQDRVDSSAAFPPLPFDDRTWRAIVESLGLSAQQARIVELTLRSACNKQIATALGIGEPTVKTYLQRVFARLDVRDRMELAMRVLAVSHEVASGPRCPTSGGQPTGRPTKR